MHPLAFIAAFATIATAAPAQGNGTSTSASPSGTSNSPSSSSSASSSNGQYTIPQNAADPKGRAAAIQVTRAGFIYGPPIGAGPYFPAGALGSARAATDLAQLQLEANQADVLSATEETEALLGGLLKYNGLQTLQDYTELYDGEWTSTLPNGPVAGMLTNYTSDLLFAMERLSFSPFAVRRLNPASDSLSFNIPDATAQKVAGMTQQQLFSEGRLFYADHRSQLGLPKTLTGKYAAACDAFFYIDKTTGDFLPFAIRTNVGSNLIYTPADTAADWMLAKIMYNVNDFWFAQWNHLAQTHMVVQIAYLAAIRTLSADHPVLAILGPSMYEAFAVMPIGTTLLFTPGTFIDQNFAFSGLAAASFSNNLYFSGGAGRFQANYLETDMAARGLVNSAFGPALKNVPYYEDASEILAAQTEFFSSFVDSYYPDADALSNDNELQAWIAEASAQAKAIDFPAAPLSSKDTLVSILAQMAYLVSAAHSAVNTNELLSCAATLPLHPMALAQAPPTKKGISNAAAYLPKLEAAISQINLASLFSRYYMSGTSRTVMNTFDNSTMMNRMNSATQAAATAFKGKMQQFSDEINGRGFDGNGLSQGMPFVWKALDPNVIPYSGTI